MSFLSSFAESVLSGFLNKGANEASILLSCNFGSINLPVLPSSFMLSVSNKNGTVNINNEGEYNMIGKTGLKTITLESFFPAQEYDFCLCSPESPSSYVTTIESWRTSGSPCQLTITGTPIDMPCLIESFTYGSKDSTPDLYYSLVLKEYRYIAGISPTKMDSLTGLKTRPAQSFLQKTVQNLTMYPGENPLQSIARAVGKTVGAGITPQQSGYLAIYQKIMKHGGLSVGDAIELGKRSIKINGRNI